MKSIFFPAEWYPQSGIQLTWPHSDSDWADNLDEIVECFITISKEIIKREKLIIVTAPDSDVRQFFTEEDLENITFAKIQSNDTWARDHGAISAFIYEQPTLIDFGFNGWGLKFAANHDNLLARNLMTKSVFKTEVGYRSHLNFILEGGSIETDGNGTLLTTSKCLLASNRNQPMEREDIEDYLKKALGQDRVLWLNYGLLLGDDTDGHIDTLARFCSEDTIAYVKCDDTNDPHYLELKLMEVELKSFVTTKGKSYKLVPLPMADPLYGNSGYLPATYANFLIINGAVLVPTYGTAKDEIAKKQLQKLFPDREIVGINSIPLIKQHGSLHCVTMQFPEGFVR